MNNHLLFSPSGEKVLCFHGPLLYEAKAIKFQVQEKAVRYYVHYQGWNKSWDEWVPENRVLKYNEANIEKQRELKESHEALKGKKKKRAAEGIDNLSSAGSPLPATTASVGTSGKVTRAASKEVDGRNKKIKLEPNVESEIEFTKKVEVKIKLPDELKNWLVDDWDFINRQKKLTEVPAKITVDQILDQYLQNNKKKNSSQAAEMCNGIKEYFNTTLGCQLLYKFERPQYQKAQRESPQDAPMSSVYGIIHLVRLFVKLGQMLVYTDLDEKDMATLLTHIHEFLRYLARSSLFDANSYHSAPPEYHRKTL